MFSFTNTLCLQVLALNLEGKYYYAHFINEKTEPETRLQAWEIYHLHSASYRGLMVKG